MAQNKKTTAVAPIILCRRGVDRDCNARAKELKRGSFQSVEHLSAKRIQTNDQIRRIPLDKGDRRWMDINARNVKPR